MKQLPLGDTGIDVSALSLGCMYFGSRTDEATSYGLLDQYAAAGGHFLDTANCYAFWMDGCVGDESESLLGRWMKSRNNREQMFIASKVGARPLDTHDSVQGLSAAVIHDNLAASLERLQTDYLDLYYAHLDDHNTPLEETLGVFAELVEAGKVRYIGCSNTHASRIQQARHICEQHGWPAYCCVQQRYSYLQPSPGADYGSQVFVDHTLLDYCRSHSSVSLLAYAPLLGGAYTREDRELPAQYQWPENEARLAALDEVCHETGATRNQVVLAWLMQGSPRVIPVMAASNSSQLEENLQAANLDLTDRQMMRLNLVNQH